MIINKIIGKIIKKFNLYDLYYYFGQETGEYSKRNKHKRIYVLIEPEYGNLGDQAIALATERFLEDQFAD